MPLSWCFCGRVAFCNAWDHRAAPWMAQATIKLFKLEWSAVGRLLSQGRLTICTLWNWSLTKYMAKEEQQNGGLECMEASTCIWGPVFQTQCFATGCTSRVVTCKWSQSRHFVEIVFIYYLFWFAWRVFVCWGFLGFLCVLFVSYFGWNLPMLCIFTSLKKID